MDFPDHCLRLAVNIDVHSNGLFVISYPLLFMNNQFRSVKNCQHRDLPRLSIDKMNRRKNRATKDSTVCKFSVCTLLVTTHKYIGKVSSTSLTTDKFTPS